MLFEFDTNSKISATASHVLIAATKLLSNIFAQLHNVFDSCLVGTTKGEHCMHKIHKGDLRNHVFTASLGNFS